MENNYRDFMQWYRGFCWTSTLLWPLYATINLWYISSLPKLKNPLSLLIKTRYLFLVTFILAFITLIIIVLYACGIFLGTVWSSTETMKTVTGSVLGAQGAVNFMGVFVMCFFNAGPVMAERWKPCCCGSCPWAPGEELAPGVPNPVSLEKWIKVAKVVEKVNDAVDTVNTVTDAVGALSE